MVTIKMEYQGELHCKAVHGPSGTELSTDAPKDNQGRGRALANRPGGDRAGELHADDHGHHGKTLEIDIKGTTAVVEKEMTAEPPRRIASLSVKIHVPHGVSAENRLKLERAAHTCPVHKSLHPDIKTPIEFIWG